MIITMGVAEVAIEFGPGRGAAVDGGILVLDENPGTRGGSRGEGGRSGSTSHTSPRTPAARCSKTRFGGSPISLTMFGCSIVQKARRDGVAALSGCADCQALLNLVLAQT